MQWRLSARHAVASRPSEDPKLVMGLHAVALERKAWSQPVDAGAISDRGKQQARPPRAACKASPAEYLYKWHQLSHFYGREQRMCMLMHQVIRPSCSHK